MSCDCEVKKKVIDSSNTDKYRPFFLNKYSDKLSSLLYDIFSNVQYITDNLSWEIPYLYSLADKLPEKQSAFIVTLDSLKQEIDRVNRNNAISKKEIKDLSDKLKLIIEGYQNVEEIKKSVRAAMQDEGWPWIKNYWCGLSVMVDYINEAAAENALHLCNYLVNQIDVVKNNLDLIKEIIDQLEDAISIVIKLRLKQIEANWSEINENVVLFKQQPNYWQGC